MRRALCALLAAGALAVAGCGGDGDEDATTDDETSETTAAPDDTSGDAAEDADGSTTTTGGDDAEGGAADPSTTAGDSSDGGSTPTEGEGEGDSASGDDAATGANGGSSAFCAGFNDGMTALTNGEAEPAAIAEDFRALEPPAEIAEQWPQFVDILENGGPGQGSSPDNQAAQDGMAVTNYHSEHCPQPTSG